MEETKEIKKAKDHLSNMRRVLQDAEEDVQLALETLNALIEKEFERNNNLISGETKLISSRKESKVYVYYKLYHFSKNTELAFFDRAVLAFLLKKDGTISKSTTTLYRWEIEK
jgi:hypothetical protein